jgi:hypothetical protein
MRPALASGELEKRDAAAADARLVDLLPGPGRRPPAGCVVVRRVRAAPGRAAGTGIGGEAGKEPAHELASGSALGRRDVAFRAGRDREQRTRVLALRTRAHEEQAFAGDRSGRRLSDALDPPELAAFGVVADHEPATDRDDLRAPLGSARRADVAHPDVRPSLAVRLTFHAVVPSGVQGHEERLAVVVVELVDATVVDHRGRRRAEVEIDGLGRPALLPDECALARVADTGRRYRRRRRRPALRPWPASRRVGVLAMPSTGRLAVMRLALPHHLARTARRGRAPGSSPRPTRTRARCPEP